ncbi:MAG TPA: Uma2 family endonuclease [Enhygromyxa sp.]|nr:Uma2 family endonuclease [Enhygromyxa sp.]
MSDAAKQIGVPYEEYLREERKELQKHEWIDGEVFAMAGGSLEHARLQSAISRALGNALLGRPCVVYSSDARIRSRATNIATYPDVTVVCGGLETDSEDRDAITNPRLIVEVLSPSTEAYDRGTKAEHYRAIPSLCEYVLVSQDVPRIEVFRRAEGGKWILSVARAGDSLTLESLDCTIAVDEVYANPLANQ